LESITFSAYLANGGDVITFDFNKSDREVENDKFPTLKNSSVSSCASYSLSLFLLLQLSASLSLI